MKMFFPHSLIALGLLTPGALDHDPAPRPAPKAELKATPRLVVSSSPKAAPPVLCDFMPTSREVILNTDFTQFSTSCGVVNVTGGVFIVRNVHIPAGVTVRVVGSKPMIWIVCGDFRVDGRLTLRGEDGVRTDTIGSANFPTPGGRGACSGGDGGRGSPNTTGRSFVGEAGNGPLNLPGLGGQGGAVSNLLRPTCTRGSGGGGGSMVTMGDPYFVLKVGANNSFVQQQGQGGFGCVGQSGSLQRDLPGGPAGPVVFHDARPDNNFFGAAYNVQRRMAIPGELFFPVGGSGGGGGGDRASGSATSWVADMKGGGGGGGGGALVVAAAGKIEIGAIGCIDADGGNGGGGALAGGNTDGGGGGAGSGGMVILYSLTGIEIQVHGETYANGDFDFPISADGGIGTQGVFGGVAVSSKYPIATRFAYDNNPTGGMGGLGVVQLMAPAGSNADGTNTILDDNVHMLRGATRLMGAEKQRYLAWRGFPNAQGIWVDDLNRPTNIGDNEGDVRPTPILMPAW